VLSNFIHSDTPPAFKAQICTSWNTPPSQPEWDNPVSDECLDPSAANEQLVDQPNEETGKKADQGHS